MKLTGYDASFMENKVFEATYGQRAVSTIRILQWSHDQGIPTCYITNSIANACPGFSHSSSTLNAVNTALANGHIVIIPRQDFTVGHWSGTGYIDLNPSTGAAGYIISGGFSGEISACGGSTVDVWPIDLGCEPVGDVFGVITPENFTDGGVLCADNSYLSYSVDLEYDCEDADGNITTETFSDSHTIPITTLEMVETYGPGTYTLSIPDADVDPVSFTLVHVEFTKSQDTVCWQQNGTYDAKALLTSDSTKDDSLLSWTISPHSASIDSSGKVSFGSAGGNYTIGVSVGGGGACSATLNLQVIKLKFSKTEDIVTWQNNGTYDAKALLSSGSTTDDSLLTWSITPSGASISASGQVTFGSAAKNYDVTVAAKANAGCSATFRLKNCVTETVTASSAQCGTTYGAIFSYCFGGAQNWWFKEKVKIGSVNTCVPGAIIDQTSNPIQIASGCPSDEIYNQNGPPANVADCTIITDQIVFTGPTQAEVNQCQAANTQVITVTRTPGSNPPSGTVVTSSGGVPTSCNW